MAMSEMSRVLERIDASSMVNRAAEYAATKAELGVPNRTFTEIDSGNVEAYLYFRYALAKESVQVLIALNDTVKEAFLFFENRCEAIPGTPLHLGVMVTRKTAALESLADSLAEAILVSAKARLAALEGLQHLVVIDLLDQSDVQSKVGVAAALGSLYEPPIRLWPVTTTE
ncbi:MAG: hypothetical protein AB1497_01515 [Bacillota bacterium]